MSHQDNGLRLLRYNDKISMWDESGRRILDLADYSLVLSPVTADDTGIYHCLINNRGVTDDPIHLTVQGEDRNIILLFDRIRSCLRLSQCSVDTYSSIVYYTVLPIRIVECKLLNVQDKL